MKKPLHPNFSKALLFFLIFVFFSTGVLALTQSFGSLTPVNNTRSFNTSYNISINIAGASTLSNFTFNWNGTNAHQMESLTALWMNFDNVSAIGDNSTYFTDISPNNYTCIGKNLNSNEVVNGVFGKGINFSSTTSEYIECASFPRSSLKTASGWLLAGRIFLYAGPQDTSGYSRIEYDITDTVMWVTIRSPSSGNYKYWKAVPSSAWTFPFHFVIMQNDMETPQLFINGVNVSSLIVLDASSGSASRPAGTNLWINRYSNSGTYYSTGQIDELRIFNRLLSADEITLLYRSNLNKYTGTDWNFYYNATSLSGPYTYYSYANNTTSTETLGPRYLNAQTRPTTNNDWTVNGDFLFGGDTAYDNLDIGTGNLILPLGSKLTLTNGVNITVSGLDLRSRGDSIIVEKGSKLFIK